MKYSLKCHSHSPKGSDPAAFKTNSEFDIEPGQRSQRQFKQVIAILGVAATNMVVTANGNCLNRYEHLDFRKVIQIQPFLRGLDLHRGRAHVMPVPCIFLVAHGDELFPVSKIFGLDPRGLQIVQVCSGYFLVQIREIVAELCRNPEIGS